MFLPRNNKGKEDEEPEEEKEPEKEPENTSNGSTSNLPARPSPPSSLPHVLAIPIARRPLFPGFYKAVVIRDQSVIKAVKELVKNGKGWVGAFLLKEKEGEQAEEAKDKDVIENIDDVWDTGVFAQITSVFTVPNNATGTPGTPGTTTATDENDGEQALTAVLYPHRRIKLTELVRTDALQEGVAASTAGIPLSPDLLTLMQSDNSLSTVITENMETEPYDKDSPQIRALVAEVIGTLKDIAQLNPLFRDQITSFSINQVASNIFDEADKLADFAAAVCSGGGSPETSQTLQSILSSPSIPTRLQGALLLLRQELVQAQLQAKLSRDLDSRIAKRQREYYLTEQLRSIKKELGIDTDGSRERLVTKLRERVDGKMVPMLDPESGKPLLDSEGKEQLKREGGLDMPVEARRVFEEELSKLQTIEPSSSEASVTRNYLDWLSSIPWGVYSEDALSLNKAKTQLDLDHHGLEEVKQRILEFIAVGRMRGKVEGKIILLVGPPGVGKTSIGKSIAKALERRFFRFSVGGLTDVAEIKGHRRTYVGALPGKIVQALKRAGTSNPLVLIDEIDKIGGRGYNGDPGSALLEMLDGEQNGEFGDHYMDIPINLSRILFVCTANTTSTIPAPLLDRMEVIEVSGYVSEEKVQIAKTHLAPLAKTSSGLENLDVELTIPAVRTLIRDYARESGVRGLKGCVEKIYRKAALEIVQSLPEDLDAAKKEEVVGTVTEAVESASSESTDTSSPGAPLEESANASRPASEPQSGSTAQPLEIPDHIKENLHIRIGPDSLKKYLGPPVYAKDRPWGRRGPSSDVEEEKEPLKEEEQKEAVQEASAAEEKILPPPGVSTGLGYLGNGSGSVLSVEVIQMPGKGSLILTGKLGEVIRESATIALSWVKAFGGELRIAPQAEAKAAGEEKTVPAPPTNSATPIASMSASTLDNAPPPTLLPTFLDSKDVHVHMPEGSVGKEGPSAGTAILTAFVSLFTGRGVDPDIALTGEISLVGSVLPVGGLKEKILAAHRAGIKKIIAPKGNQLDIEENVPASVKEGITLVYVEDVRSVLKEVFGEEVLVSRSQAEHLKSKGR